MDPDASHGRFRVRIVGGRLVAHCEISTVHRRIPANLFIDLESPSGFQLHNRVAAALKVENAAGEAIPISIHFPEFRVQVERREAGPERDFNEFTRLYSREIDEDALVGALGTKFFKDYGITLDLHHGYMHLTPPGARRTRAEESLEVSLTTTDDVIWLPVQLPGGAVASMALATAEADSLIDEVWCDELGHPAGDVSPIQLGDLNLSERVAFRPAGINYVHQDGALGVIGLNLLEQLRIEIDHGRTLARIKVMVPAEYPEADFAFYLALIDDDPGLYEAYLRDYPGEKHSQEAARRLLHLRMDEGGEPEAFERAIAWVGDSWRKDMRSTRALDLMKELSEAGYPRMALEAGELGVEGGRDDRYPNSVHYLHSRMGEILLEEKEDKAAWRHLLSAAFGLPEDGMINLRLGEFYERQGRYQRAMSRYVQAVIHVESGEQAVAGLERVNRMIGDEERLSVDRIEPLIAGKTYGYTAATRYRLKDGEQETNRVTLVEFFTNAHLKHPTRDEGAIGGALGNDGVLSYFPREKVAVLAYHLPHPELAMDCLTNEVAQAQADVYRAPPVLHLVNGRVQFAGAGKARDAEKIYKRGRELVTESLREPSEFRLDLSAEVAGDSVRGLLEIAGPVDRPAKVHVILAERGVLYPGRSKVVIHRMVARAALTPSASGETYDAPEGGRMRLSFDRSLAEMTRRNELYLERLQAAGRGAVQKFAARMDPKQLTIVAFVRDARTLEVLQAVQMDPQSVEETS